MAAQLRNCLDDQAGGVVARPAAGRWLIDKVFTPGASLHWRALVETATGVPLDSRYFVESLA
jgi:hypothetical protein